MQNKPHLDAYLLRDWPSYEKFIIAMSLALIESLLLRGSTSFRNDLGYTWLPLFQRWTAAHEFQKAQNGKN